MTDPRVYYNDIIRKSIYGITDQEGNYRIGDGTFYSASTSSTCDQDNNYFYCSAPTVIDDATDQNDEWNNMFLWFPASNNIYTILDYVSASTRFTVSEVPSENDTGASRVVYACYGTDGWFDDTEPYRFANGIMSDTFQWTPSTTVTAENYIEFAQPNIIIDGGFEMQGAAESVPTDNWSTSVGDAWISPSTALVGSKHVDAETSGDYDIFQNMDWVFDENKTYRIEIAAQAASTTYTSAGLNVKIQSQYETSGHDDLLDWDVPLASTALEWHSTSFSPSETMGEKQLYIYYDYTLSGDGNVGIDEVYLWEYSDENSLLIGKYNVLDRTDGGAWYTRQCSVKRTTAPSNTKIADFADATYNGRDYFYYTTSSTITHPVHVLNFAVDSTDYDMYAGNIFIGNQWIWDQGIPMPNDPDKRTCNYTSNETEGGVGYDDLKSEIRMSEATLWPVGTTEAALWLDFWLEDGRDRNPIWFQSMESSEPYYARSMLETFERPYNPVLRQVKFKFKELK